MKARGVGSSRAGVVGGLELLMWVLGSELRGRTANTFNCKTISRAPQIHILLFIYLFSGGEGSRQGFSV